MLGVVKGLFILHLLSLSPFVLYHPYISGIKPTLSLMDECMISLMVDIWVADILLNSF